MEYPNKKLRFGHLPMSDRGRVIQLPIDQTPVVGQKKNLCGFFKSDVRLLMEASENGDKAEFEKLANRLEMVSEPDNKKSVKQLFDEWKPNYLQTMSELQSWPVYLKNTHPDVYDRLYGEEDKAFEASRQSASGTPDVEPVESSKSE